MKGQHSLEYLSSLGWALVIILVVFSVLVYAGIISPSVLKQERCDASRDFLCLDKPGKAGSAILLVLSNYKPSPIELLDGSDGYPPTGDTCTVDPELQLYKFQGIPYTDIPAGGITIPKDTIFNLAATLLGQTNKCTLRIHYRNVESQLVHTALIEFKL